MMQWRWSQNRLIRTSNVRLHVRSCSGDFLHNCPVWVDGNPALTLTLGECSWKPCSEVHVGIDVAKAKHAIADNDRLGNVRYFGEIDSDPVAVRCMVTMLEKLHQKFHFYVADSPATVSEHDRIFGTIMLYTRNHSMVDLNGRRGAKPPTSAARKGRALPSHRAARKNTKISHALGPHSRPE
jgi:hypothetical protein